MPFGNSFCDIAKENRDASPFPNPNGVASYSPAVARNELPWVKMSCRINPERVESVRVKW